MRRFPRKKARDCGAGDWLPFTVGFPGDAVAKNPPANAGEVRETGWIPGLGRSPGGGNDDLLQHSCLENSMHRKAWWATVQGATSGT